MSENNEKIPEVTAKKKSDKPNFFVRVAVRIKKFFKDYSSEMKKIVWLPWDQTKKSTLVVCVVLVVCAAVICLLDVGLSKGFIWFIELFTKA